MARGRKRLIAGWGLIGLGVAVAGLMLASGWFALWCDPHGQWGLGVNSGAFFFGPTLRVGASTQGSCGYTTLRTPGLRWILPPAEYPYDLVVNLQLFAIARHQPPLSAPALWYGYFMLWPIALATLTVGTPTLISARRARRRARLGQCRACGYALAGLAPGAPCPECGKGAGLTLNSQG